MGGLPREMYLRIFEKMSQSGYLVRERQADVTDKAIIQFVTIRHHHCEYILKIYVNKSQFGHPVTETGRCDENETIHN